MVVDGVEWTIYNYTVVLTNQGGNAVTDSVAVYVITGSIVTTTTTTDWHPPSEPSYDWPLLIGVAIIGIGAVALVILLVMRSRR